MPYCKSCHQEISKFDRDICPHCGQKNPIDASYRTMDITTDFSSLEGSIKDLPKSKSHKKAAILKILFGYLGVHDFYLCFTKKAWIELLVTVVLVVGVGLPLLFLTSLPKPLAFLIPFVVIWLFYILTGLWFLKAPSPKDGRGEYLR